MKQEEPTRQELIKENETLKERLCEAEQTIKAIRGGEVDAFVVQESGEEQFTPSREPMSHTVFWWNPSTRVRLSLPPMIRFFTAMAALARWLACRFKKSLVPIFGHFSSPIRRRWLLIKSGKREKPAWQEANSFWNGSGGTLLPVALSLNFITMKDFDVVCAIVTDLSGQKQVEEELRRHRTELEFLVTERTADLARTNVELQQEIIERKRMEEALLEAHNKLELRVLERTAELSENERKFRNLSQEFHTLLHAISDTLILFSPKWKYCGQTVETSPVPSLCAQG